MHTKMALIAPAELANAIRRRYRSATGKVKRKILDEFIAATGYHEKSAIRVLNGQLATEGPPTCLRRSVYDEMRPRARRCSCSRRLPIESAANVCGRCYRFNYQLWSATVT